MLKWTASAQKLTQETLSVRATTTPRPQEPRRRLRRATISNKENIPFTSTPMVPRTRNSPLVLAPLSDILNVTPESPVTAAVRTPERRRVPAASVPVAIPHRRHSTAGLSTHLAPQYASTLPRFEEEYSPSTVLPTGQQLALRGLLPDPFLGNPRYFNTPELEKQKREERGFTEFRKSLPKKRKLADEFAKIAEECVSHSKQNAIATASSAKMGDKTLDKLIDAILDSARKDEKKKKPRRSFNLRRRTLLRNQAEHVGELILSPSYAAGDDPASDLSFLLSEPASSRTATRSSVPSTATPPTPAPVTPPPGTPIADAVLQQMPTPAPALTPITLHTLLHSAAKATLDRTFELETPVRGTAKKRRQRRLTEGDNAAAASVRKKFKADERDYFEIGLALPSIYV